MNRAVFLDRDNTLIRTDGDLGDPELVELMEGVADGLRALRRAGFRLIVTTNQAGVALGRFTEDDVDAIHQQIAHLVDEQARTSHLIDRFYYCPFHPEGNEETYRREHPWRIPSPGMLLQAARDLDIDLSESWMIGDQAAVVAAGRAAGCRTVLVSHDPQVIESARPWSTATGFIEAVQQILDAAHANGTTNGSGIGSSRRCPATASPIAESQSSDPARSGESGATDEGADHDDQRPSAPSPIADHGSVERHLVELLDELRTERMRRVEFTVAKMAAGISQMLVMLFVLLALLHMDSLSAFVKWIAVAGLGQLVVISLLLLDARS